MNLLAHYHLAGRGRPGHRLGAVLPDLLGMFSRKARPRQFMAFHQERLDQGDATPTIYSEVLAGMAHHHAVDVVFHHHPVFTETQAAIQQTLVETSQAPGLKRFLPAHVLCELYLDHLLVHDHPTLPERFLADLSAGQQDVTEMAMQALPPCRNGFADFLRRVIRDRFVEDYQHLDGLFPRLQRILVRCRQRMLTADEITALKGCLTREKPAIQAALNAFMATAPQAEDFFPLSETAQTHENGHKDPHADMDAPQTAGTETRLAAKGTP